MASTLENNIYEALGLQDLPGEEKMLMLSKMTELVLKRSMNEIADNLEALGLPQAEQDAIANETDDAKRLELVQKHVPDFAGIIQKHTDAVKTELIALVQ